MKLTWFETRVVFIARDCCEMVVAAVVPGRECGADVQGTRGRGASAQAGEAEAHYHSMGQDPAHSQRPREAHHRARGFSHTNSYFTLIPLPSIPRRRRRITPAMWLD